MLNFGKKKNLEVEKRKLSLDQQIEAILFFKGEEVSLANLVKILGYKKKEIKEGVNTLRERLKNSALILIENNDKYLLATDPGADEIINLIKEKQSFNELSQAALETLAIILYNGEIGRDEIDQIRGINSSYILRNLLIRGLIEKKNYSGSTKYIPTIDLLAFMGIEKIEEMPAFEAVREKLDLIKKEFEDNENEEKENGDENNNTSSIEEVKNKENNLG